MIQLTEALNAWGSGDFKAALKMEVEQLGAENLPLQSGLSIGSYAMDNKLQVIILSVSDSTNAIFAKAGIFYTGIIAGCSCADDPTPVDEHNEYCEVEIEINKDSADTIITLLPG